MDTIKILFLAADPSDAVRLRLGQELRDIREKLQLSRCRDRFSLESRESVRTGDITQAIFDTEPQIIHFSGHGTVIGELCFEDILGKTKPVKPSALANLFKLVSSQVSCVVLNACYSESQAKQIAKHISFVIGMNKAIGDEAAIAFAVGFYKALGAGHSVKKAWEFACVEIQLAGIPEHSTPILLEKIKIEKELDHEKGFVSTPSFFSDRFSKAFPGVRGVQEFNSPAEAIIRLTKLLEDPLTLKINNQQNNPIWWFRGHKNLQITYFEHLDTDMILIDRKELKVKRVVAANSCEYYQCFVYVEAYPMEPVGIYDRGKHDIQRQINKIGYSYEEFAIYQRKFFITREEYDDGAAFIDGKLVDLEPSSTEVRFRHLSPYNIVIAAFESPINNYSFDENFELIMDGILKGNADIEDLNQAVLKLPRRSFI